MSEDISKYTVTRANGSTVVVTAESVKYDGDSPMAALEFFIVDEPVAVFWNAQGFVKNGS